MSSEKPVVISLHGIRTRGLWQKELAPELALGGFVPYALDYGYVGALQLARPSSLDKQVRRLLGEYDRIRAATRCERPSVIAHSFGTLQIAHLLRKYSEVIFDKVILTAGIVPVDFPWANLLAKQRVMWVMNEYGGKDVWPKLAGLVIPHAPIGVLKIDGLEVAPSLLAKPLCENNNVLNVLLRLGAALGANRFVEG
jgi:serine/threonine-protein kinase